MNANQPALDKLRTRRGAKWAKYPPDVIPAWVADMDFEVAGPIREALARRITNSDLGYPVTAARSGLPELFAERVAQRFGWDIGPAQVELFTDVVQGFYVAVSVLCEPGDGVVIQTPIYPPFLHAAQETGRRAVCCPLVRGPNGFEIDFDTLDARIDPGTRVLLFCHPHNPSGRAFTRQELEGVAECALKHQLYVVSDEIHADLMLDDRPHIVLASIAPEIAARTITLMSASKAFNMAGMRIAFGVFGSDEVKRRFAKLPRHVRGGISTLSMVAVNAAWTEGQTWLDEVLGLLRANRDRLAGHVAENWPRIVHFPPQATYLAWLDCRALALPGGPHEYFLSRAKVALSDGADFGEPGRGFVRLNFATSPAILDEILDRMDRALEQAL